MFSKNISLVYSSAMMDPHHRFGLAQQFLQLDAYQNDVVQQHATSPEKTEERYKT